MPTKSTRVPLANESDVLDTYYLLTSADHNIVQVNKINSDGTLGSMVSDLSRFPVQSAYV